MSTSVSYAIRAIQSAPSEVQPAEKIAREPGVPAQVLLDVKHFVRDYGGQQLPAVTALGHGVHLDRFQSCRSHGWESLCAVVAACRCHGG